MKKVAFVFVLAVLAPSLILAWLAVRSLRDQQLVLERQQSLLCQSVADAAAKTCGDRLLERKRDFGLEVEKILGAQPPVAVASDFDDSIRRNWSLVEVGFAVSLDGTIYSPSLFGRAESRRFRLQNDRFLSSHEPVEVFYTSRNMNLAQLDAKERAATSNNPAIPENKTSSSSQSLANNSTPGNPKAQKRTVSPQNENGDEPQQYSKIVSTESDFRQVVGDEVDGIVARFLEDKLKLLVWYRSPRNPQLVFGAELKLAQIVSKLSEEFASAGFIDPALSNQVCVALLDDTGRPAALTQPGFKTDWKHPIASSEVGTMLPHWEVAVALLNAKSLAHSAQTVRLTLGLLIAVLVLAIGGGGWLVFTDLRRQLALARQKTDFVSNVSHELKTPLTSIRMFSELLGEGRVTDPAKHRAYLSIITSETARLTRLINNVLDFARMDRGEKRYDFQDLDIAALVFDAVEAYRPHLEATGFKVISIAPKAPRRARGNADALAQIIVNLISNVEKYSLEKKEIEVRIERASANGGIEVRVMDRGPGIPKGCEEKIFLQFFRAHDSLSSGIQGSGLGLTLARQIARAHGGDVLYWPRPGGGSVFQLRVPEIEILPSTVAIALVNTGTDGMAPDSKPRP